jgi:peptidoglycan/xylan/chitin deacetylase (PgdA/CDA1 family)
MLELKLLKALKIALFLSVFAGCFGGAFLLIQVLSKADQKFGVAEAIQKTLKSEDAPELPKPAVGSSSRDLSAIVQDYQRRDEMAKAGTPDAMSLDGSTTVAALAKPVRTPGPDLKLIREWPTGRKRVALTFDDGPSPQYTRAFIDLLKSKNARATFFLLGPNVTSHPDLVRDLVAGGFELGNHSWSHPTLSKLSPEKIRAELQKTSDAIREASGQNVTVMRPPYGTANKKVQDICEEMGLKIICWSIDTDDWRKTTTEEQMVENVKKNARDGSIVLMHDRSDKVLKTTAAAIDILQAQGYEFVTVSELLGLQTPAIVAAPAPARTPSPAPEVVTAGSRVVIVDADAGSQQDGGRSAELPTPPGMTPASRQPATAVQALPDVSPEKVTVPPGSAPAR